MRDVWWSDRGIPGGRSICMQSWMYSSLIRPAGVATSKTGRTEDIQQDETHVNTTVTQHMDHRRQRRWTQAGAALLLLELSRNDRQSPDDARPNPLWAAGGAAARNSPVFGRLRPTARNKVTRIPLRRRQRSRRAGLGRGPLGGDVPMPGDTTLS